MKKTGYTVPIISCVLVRERKTRPIENIACDHPDIARKIAHSVIGSRSSEHLILIALDSQTKPAGVHTLAIGGVAGLDCSLREIFRAALLSNASAFILAHNHPSGNRTPSAEDIAFTAKVRTVSQDVGVPLVDHLIVTDDPEVFSSAVVHSSMWERVMQ